MRASAELWWALALARLSARASVRASGYSWSAMAWSARVWSAMASVRVSAALEPVAWAWVESGQAALGQAALVLVPVV